MADHGSAASAIDSTARAGFPVTRWGRPTIGTVEQGSSRRTDLRKWSSTRGSASSGDRSPTVSGDTDLFEVEARIRQLRYSVTSSARSFSRRQSDPQVRSSPVGLPRRKISRSGVCRICQPSVARQQEGPSVCHEGGTGISTRRSHRFVKRCSSWRQDTSGAAGRHTG